MHDDLNARDSAKDVGGSRPSREVPRESGARPMADREVPIGVSRTTDLVHAWLDGELSESALVGQDAGRQIEFWKRLDRDLESRRHMQTPAYVTQRIMDALPQETPAVTPWWSKPIAMTPITVAAAATSLLALGAALGASIRVR
jgi:hypothetical protein